MSTVSSSHDLEHGHAEPPRGLTRWLITTNHKDIGTLYLLFSLTMFFIGGTMALIIRAELCGKDHGFMPIVVRAVSKEEYASWLAAEKAKRAPAEPAPAPAVEAAPAAAEPAASDAAPAAADAAPQTEQPAATVAAAG